MLFFFCCSLLQPGTARAEWAHWTPPTSPICMACRRLPATSVTSTVLRVRFLLMVSSRSSLHIMYYLHLQTFHMYCYYIYGKRRVECMYSSNLGQLFLYSPHHSILYSLSYSLNLFCSNGGPVFHEDEYTLKTDLKKTISGLKSKWQSQKWILDFQFDEYDLVLNTNHLFLNAHILIKWFDISCWTPVVVN